MLILHKVFLAGAVTSFAVGLKLEGHEELQQQLWFNNKGQFEEPPGSPPQRPTPWPSEGNETVYTTLSKHKDYTKLNKAINFVDEIVTILNDSSTDITFFAVPDSALRPPHRRHLNTDVTDISSLVQAYDLSDVVHLVDQFETLAHDNKGDRKRRKKFLQRLVRAILAYHILPSKYSSARLSDNNTYATNLLLPSAMGTRPLRIRVSRSLIFPSPTINFYSSVFHPDGVATNGMIHGINHPLLPPPPIFQELFMVPSAFATFTSAIQRTGLTSSLDLKYIRGKHGKKGNLEGATATTIFAPSNHAFEVLPPKLRLFLFSPFGTRVLRKLLQYHIVPGLVFHTDNQFNNSKTSTLTTHTHREAFDISKIGSLGSDSYPLQYHESLFSCSGLGDLPFEHYLSMEETHTFYPQGDFAVHQEEAEEKAPSPRNPFKFNSDHWNEILAMDTEHYEALTDKQQEYVAKFLELYDYLNGETPSYDSHPIHDSKRPQFPGSFHSTSPISSMFVDDGDQSEIYFGHTCHSAPLPFDDFPLCASTEEESHPEPIESFDVTLPTLLANHTIHAHVEKYNLTLPFPGPHKPHRTSTRFTVNGRAVVLQDIVGLNGAVHLINHLIDPRGHDHRDPATYSTWEDWEYWLPQWAAEN